MKILVLHRGYGCDTGCCGHAVEVDGTEVGFHFEHPEDFNVEAPQFVRDLVTRHCGEAHVKDIDWDHCIVVND